MKRSLYIISSTLILVFLIAVSSAEAELVLVKEYFNDSRSQAQARGWADQYGDPNASWYFEMFSGTDAFNVRGLPLTYDHDNDSLSANITVPGAIEILSNVPSNTVYRELVLPDDFGYETEGSFSFFATHRRNGGEDPLVSIYNVTDNRYVLDPTTPDEASGVWNYNEYAVSFSDQDLGDTIQLRFSDTSGNTSDSLEIATVKFAVAAPEPSLFLMFSIFLFCVSRKFSKYVFEHIE